MRKVKNIFVAVALGTLMLTGCFKENERINVNHSQLFGDWVKNNSQEYWRYNADFTGVTWDESEGISSDNSNLTYEWSISQGNVLTHVFHGAQGNQSVPKVYNIKDISSSTMKWEDDYGLSYTLNKVK